MKIKLFWGCALVLLCGALFAEETVILRNGRRAILRDDFTWSYAETGSAESGILELNTTPDLTTELRSKTGKFSVFYNPSEWVPATGLNPDAEFQFQNADNTGYGIVLHDGLSISPEQMKSILIFNARNIDPDTEILESQKAIVNGAEGEIITYAARFETLRFIFYALVTNNEKGTIQFTFYTLDSVFDQLKPQFQRAMAGLIF
ncbi:DUF3157 family protein [Breznakiella homolactica]|uniref:DUF3157 family protein n=1 Tax=Breznakiella homolactica TaxID=2798577 RepID=A0A7T7XNJ0_9SPIR|nr:DUF3157 family protein [Breznakiella homolactica]QQO09624.1 DUF3157 family protein [Breznakiella homolactica]